MDAFRDVVMWLGVAGIWVFCFWFAKSLCHLKSMTESMKNVFDSMQASA